jgi:superfamily I DNA/RNA helicase
MKMAGLKGLTVRATIVAGIENDIVPNPRTNPSEERRLLYVAMTRSTEFLFLTWANRRKGHGARSGTANVWGIRQHCGFLDHGLVESEKGEQFLSLQLRFSAQHGAAMPRTYTDISSALF